MSGPSLEERFWAKVAIRGADECWPWTGYVKPNGYGGFWNGKAPVSAHRVSYEIANGIAPTGDVDHTCHNGTECPGGGGCPHRACCNPAHLEDVTHQENVRRGRAGTYPKAFKAACIRGHAYDDSNTYHDRNGYQRCRACARDRQARLRKAAA